MGVYLSGIRVDLTPKSEARGIRTWWSRMQRKLQGVQTELP